MIIDRCLSGGEKFTGEQLMGRVKGMPQFAWLDQLEVRFDMAVMKGQFQSSFAFLCR